MKGRVVAGGVGRAGLNGAREIEEDGADDDERDEKTA